MTRSLLLALAIFLPSATATALEVPKLNNKRIHDYGELLTPEEEGQLNTLLTQHEGSTGQQFALLIVPTLDGDSLEDFSIRVVEAWKLGKQGKDDGLLMLIVPQDREMRIEVGYGLEGTITDALADNIIRNVLAPAFRQQAFGTGITEAFTTLIRAGGGEEVQVPQAPPAAAPPASAPTSEPTPPDWPGLFIFIFFVIFSLIQRLSGASSGRSGVYTASGFSSYSGGSSSGGLSGGGGSFGGGGASGSW